MKRFLALFLLLVLLTPSLCSCLLRSVTVTYVDTPSGDGATVAYLRGGYADRIPVREGYVFDGWYLDSELTRPYDAGKRLTSSLVLYASWSFDYEALANAIATEAMTSCVRVWTYRYNSRFGTVVASESSHGSGVIYKSQDGYMYCLTNEHCITKYDGYAHTEYTVIDAFGEEHAAELLFYRTDYDLAILRFASDDTLSVATLAVADAERGDITVSVGAPNGLINTVTYGELLGYRTVTDIASEGIEVAFEVGCHDTPVDHGSSGGAVFGITREVIGINFAASEDAEGNTLYAFYIPISKVREFLSLYTS
ncbi:MAG: trypsin-like peptidase domain-containing protein [Clostridia bacterium]|nr:trypsin-like peptidase domain-containing protein [Clostridia bacterium]